MARPAEPSRQLKVFFVLATEVFFKALLFIVAQSVTFPIKRTGADVAEQLVSKIVKAKKINFFIGNLHRFSKVILL
jgi:hypothetical protein